MALIRLGDKTSEVNYAFETLSEFVLMKHPNALALYRSNMFWH